MSHKNEEMEVYPAKIVKRTVRGNYTEHITNIPCPNCKSGFLTFILNEHFFSLEVFCENDECDHTETNVVTNIEDKILTIVMEYIVERLLF